jgi:hypothetical protein
MGDNMTIKERNIYRDWHNKMEYKQQRQSQANLAQECLAAITFICCIIIISFYLGLST